jgi:hypothetical protein
LKETVSQYCKRNGIVGASKRRGIVAKLNRGSLEGEKLKGIWYILSEDPGTTSQDTSITPSQDAGEPQLAAPKAHRVENSQTTTQAETSVDQDIDNKEAPTEKDNQALEEQTKRCLALESELAKIQQLNIEKEAEAKNAKGLYSEALAKIEECQICQKDVELELEQTQKLKTEKEKELKEATAKCSKAIEDVKEAQRVSKKSSTFSLFLGLGIGLLIGALIGLLS